MKVINLFGAPGAGKTTTAMWLTQRMKKEGIKAEISLEFVKEYIMSGNLNLLEYQNYIFAHQDRQLKILESAKNVEFAITDAPLLHSYYYQPEGYPISFKDFVFEVFHSYNNINFLITREHEYSKQGRIHSEIESKHVEKKMPVFLINNNIPFIEVSSKDDIETVIFEYILKNHR